MKTRRVSTYASLRNGFPFASEDFSEDGDFPLIRIRDLGNEPFQTFIDPDLVPARAQIANGQVVIGMDGDFNVRLWDRGEAALNQRLCVLDARQDSDSRFLAYALPEPLQEINDLTYATTVKHLSSQQVLHIDLPNWSPAEQRAIADFLDRETAQIDAMIEAQRELVGLLLERRRSIATRMLSEFDRVPLKRLIVSGRPLTYGILQAGEPLAEGVPYIGPADIPGEGVAPRLADLRRTSEAIAAQYKRSTLTAGDVVVSIGPAYGRVMVTTPELTGANLTQDTARVALNDSRADVGFVVKALGSSLSTEFWDRMITGATFRRLNLGTLGETPLPLPTLSEQRRLADVITGATAQIDAMIDAANESIALMQERRSALISAAVTGRVDPRTGHEYPLEDQ